MCDYQKSQKVIKDGQKKIIIKQKTGKNFKVKTNKQTKTGKLQTKKMEGKTYTFTNNKVYFGKPVEFQNNDSSSKNKNNITV